MNEYHLRKRMLAHESYYHASQPVIRKMVELRLMFTSPWMKFDANRALVESGERWTDDAAERLYHSYEAYLVILRDQMLKPM